MELADLVVGDAVRRRQVVEAGAGDGGDVEAEVRAVKRQTAGRIDDVGAAAVEPECGSEAIDGKMSVIARARTARTADRCVATDAEDRDVDTGGDAVGVR